jgi:hypothetical protein
VILTADHPWRHSIFDCTLSNKDEWYENTTNWSEGLIQSPFNLNGTFKALSETLELNIHDLLHLNDRFVLEDDT